MIEIPSDDHDTVELPLPILAAFSCVPLHIHRRISVQPLLVGHCEEGGGEGGDETRAEGLGPGRESAEDLSAVGL